jgi:gliding motility-associated-like protein
VQVASTTNNCIKAMPGSITVREILTPSNGQINTASAGTFCVGEEFDLTSSFSGDPDTFNWRLPSQVREISRQRNQITVQMVQSGIIEIFVTASNQCGNAPEVSIQLTSQENPSVTIDAIPRALFNDPMTFSYSTESMVNNATWTFSDGQSSTTSNPTVVFDKPGRYVVTIDVINPWGCMGSDQAEFEVSDGLLDVYSIKNVITPNGDGENDYLTVVDIDRYENSEVMLFDRWGNLVFQQTNYANDWDLKKGAEFLPAGNYVCVVRYAGKVYSRTVTVLKSN